MLTETQQAVRREAVEFAHKELDGEGTPGAFDCEGWRKCAAYGAMGLTVPSEYGGGGRTLAEFVALLEGLGYGSRRLGLVFAVGAHVFGTVEPVCAAGSELQKRKYLPRLASGEWIAAHGVTESSGGSDIASIATRACPEGDAWVINGEKVYITCGVAADVHVVYARTGDDRMTCFLIDPETPGVTTEALEPAGLAGCGLARVIYQDVRVPNENVLGRPGAGQMLFQSSIERERACILAFALGAMERQVELAVDYANQRAVGGSVLSDYQAVSHRIAQMKIRLEISRMLVYHVAELKSRGKRAPLEAAMTKLYASESFLENSIDLVRTFGGRGFVKEGGAEQYVRDALGGLMASGTNDIQRNIIARLVGLRGGDHARSRPVRRERREQTVP